MFIVMRFLRIWKIHANFLICYRPISLPYAMYIKREKYFLSLATHIYKMMWKEIKFAFFLFLNSILTQLHSFNSKSFFSTKGEFFFIIFNEGDAHTQYSIAIGKMANSNISESYSQKHTKASTSVEEKNFEMRLRGRRLNFPGVDVTFFFVRPESDGF